MFPYYREFVFESEDDRSVLVCIDIETSTIVSYVVCGSCDSYNENARIEMFGMEFLEFGWDYDERLLFIIMRAKDQSWIE